MNDFAVIHKAFKAKRDTTLWIIMWCIFLVYEGYNTCTSIKKLFVYDKNFGYFKLILQLNWHCVMKNNAQPLDTVCLAIQKFSLLKSRWIKTIFP